MSNYDKLNYFIQTEFPKAINKPFDGHLTSQSIDVAIAKRNLETFKRVADKYNLNFIVLFGTLLGIHREGNLISYDTDVDVAITEFEIDNLIFVLKSLKTKDFEVIRYEKDDLVSIIKDDCYIDIYLFHKQPTNYTLNIWALDFKDFDKQTQVVLDGQEYNTVADIEKTLTKFYGSDWRIPKKNFSAHYFGE